MFTEAAPKALGVEKPAGWTTETVVDPMFRKATVRVEPLDPGNSVMVGSVDPTLGLVFWIVTVTGWPPAGDCTMDGKLSSSSMAVKTLSGALPCARVRLTNTGKSTTADGANCTVPVAGLTPAAVAVYVPVPVLARPCM